MMKRFPARTQPELGLRLFSICGNRPWGAGRSGATSSVECPDPGASTQNDDKTNSSKLHRSTGDTRPPPERTRIAARITGRYSAQK